MGGAPLNDGKEVQINVKEQPQQKAGPNDLQPDLEHRISQLETTLAAVNTMLAQQQGSNTGPVIKLAQDYPVRFSQALGVLINAALFAAYTAFFGTKPDAEVALSIGVVVQYASAWIAGRYVESTAGRSNELDQPKGYPYTNLVVHSYPGENTTGKKHERLRIRKITGPLIPKVSGREDKLNSCWLGLSPKWC